MKNGKLFGKLNIIDILVILVVVAAVALVGYKALTSVSGETTVDVETQDEPNVRFVVRCEDLSQRLADNVISELENGTYNVKGETVSACRIYNSGTLLDATIVSWDILEGSEPDTVTLDVTVEANATNTSGAFTLQYQDLRLGKEYVLKTMAIELTGYTIALENLK